LNYAEHANSQENSIYGSFGEVFRSFPSESRCEFTANFSAGNLRNCNQNKKQEERKDLVVSIRVSVCAFWKQKKKPANLLERML
jgi:hypothetical protein